MENDTEEAKKLPLFRKEALLYQASRLEGEVIVGIRSPWWIIGLATAGLLVLVFIAITSVTYKRTAKIQGVTVRAFGYVVLSAERHAVVDHVFVHEGNSVSAGQKLLAMRSFDEADVTLATAGGSSASEFLSPRGANPDEQTLPGDQTFLSSPQTDLVVAAVHVTPGQLVLPNERLVELMTPAGEVAADAMVAPADYGAVVPGQPVLLRYQAFPASKHGQARGKVKSISLIPVEVRQPLGGAAAKMQTAYIARITLDRESMAAFGREITIQPGMSFDGEIIVGESS